MYVCFITKQGTTTKEASSTQVREAFLLVLTQDVAEPGLSRMLWEHEFGGSNPSILTTQK